MTQTLNEDVLKTVQELVGDASDRSTPLDGHLDTSLSDLGLDSLAVPELAVRLEARYAVSLTNEGVDPVTMRTVADLVMSKIANKS
ncbi:acyl carrier protein [Streptomyces sp. NPDC006450]|uniref:acyl carrier protein n=1 Tax=Streptomyces sp. NPDC006450 TaxID=3155458 RepID=UPI0033BEBFD8